MKLTNYHTHTELCRHATGLAVDYVKVAVREGFDIIGMSDHAPFQDEKWEMIREGRLKELSSKRRMTLKEFELYLENCDKAIELYGDDIKILKGLEIEYFDNTEDYYYELASRLDYLSLSTHFVMELDEDGLYNIQSSFFLTTEKQLELYLESTIKGMKSGLFSFLNHPDVFMNSYKEFDEHAINITKEIVKTAIELDMPIEYNGEGLRGKRGYPRNEFWEYACKTDVKILVNSDCHDPEFLNDEGVINGRKYIEGLGGNLITDIKLFKELTKKTT